MPLMSGRNWPIVIGHDWQLSCRIFYISTGSNWHEVTVDLRKLPAVKLPFTDK